MKELVKQLEEEADMVIFDSPPILPVADALILANQVDGVLLVVDAGTTRRETALRGKEQLEKVGGHPLGVVLNRISPHVGYHYYYEGE